MCKRIIKDDIKIIFVDIDNTIYDHRKKKRYDMKSVNALNALHDKGIKIIISTARPIYSIREFNTFNVLKYDGVIAANGAIRIIDNEWIDRYEFDNKTVHKILEVIKKHNLCAEFVTFDSRFYPVKPNQDVIDHQKEFYENIAPYHEYHDEQVISILLFAKKEMDDILKKDMPKNIILLRFGNFGIDVVDKIHAKGEGIKSILSHLNYSKDNALAFGDDVQDISMFESVKYGIALGNAKECVKEKAVKVIKPVYKNGIYRFVKANRLLK